MGIPCDKDTDLTHPSYQRSSFARDFAEFTNSFEFRFAPTFFSRFFTLPCSLIVVRIPLTPKSAPAPALHRISRRAVFEVFSCPLFVNVMSFL